MGTHLAKKMKDLRTKRNLTVIDCSKAVGVSPSTYREWEQGRSINGEPYQKIAETLNVSLSDLLGVKQKDVVLKLNELEQTASQLLYLINHLRSQL